MSIHSRSRCWMHYIWGTFGKEAVFTSDTSAAVEEFLFHYAAKKGIGMQSMSVNPDHIHALVDLPATCTSEQAGKLLKGASSYWINRHHLVDGKFSWERGYTVFSVSQSMVPVVTRYFRKQNVYHTEKSYREEYAQLLRVHGLAGRGWHGIR